MTEITTYAGNFVYKGTGSGLSLEYVLTPEGMVRNPASPEYHYFIKDLPNPFGMGNTRATITDADHDGVLDFNSSEILQTADYYPFGMMHYGQGGTNKYLYNGKELQEEGIGGVGLGWYDYGARFYDPAIGRWHTQDLMAEFSYDRSPYNYVSNNPINAFDPDGNFKTKLGAWFRAYKKGIATVN